MKTFLSFLVIISCGIQAFAAQEKSFYDFKIKDIHGKDFDLGQYRGKVVLVVNTASQCGFTPQLKELEQLQSNYGKKGFAVLAFPSNDFKQDPGDNQAVEDFAKKEYKITFPLMDKGPVTGDKIQPAIKFLVDSKRGLLLKDISWNFEKFLVGKNGQVVDRWNSVTKPMSSSVIEKIEQALKD